MIPICKDRHIALEIARLQRDRPDQPVTFEALAETTRYSDRALRRITQQLVATGILRRWRTPRGYFYEVIHV